MIGAYEITRRSDSRMIDAAFERDIGTEDVGS